ncbi:MAG: SH3 domain-containing protein [Burkholderiales bacterium]|nr:SH3 domain-containing protein [Burkholderiales bacterium]
MIRTFAAPLFCLLLAASANAQQKLRPLDEADNQADFAQFRQQLHSILKRHDSAALLALIHKDIQTSFGGKGGIEEFKQLWHVENPKSALWPTLSKILSLGGAFDQQGRFIAPYVYSQWPASIDAFKYVAVIGKGVRVRAAPDTSTTIVAKLDYAIVEKLETTTSDAAWVLIRLEDDTQGYIDQRLVRSAMDYHAVFDKSSGKWQLTALVAGN